MRDKLPELIVVTNWVPVRAVAERDGKLNSCENKLKLKKREVERNKNCFFIFEFGGN